MLLLEFFFLTKVSTQTSHYKRKPHSQSKKPTNQSKDNKMALSDGLTVECICFDQLESEHRKETRNYFRQSTENRSIVSFKNFLPFETHQLMGTLHS